LALLFLENKSAYIILEDNENLWEALTLIKKCFVLRVDKKQVWDENENLYILYLENYKKEIDFFKKNEKTYYQSYVKPFLSKLKEVL
jgi:hypothetical protein